MQEKIINMVLEERKRQDAKWGEQNHIAPVWGMIIGEEYGEMCQAINEFGFNPTPETLNVLREAEVRNNLIEDGNMERLTKRDETSWRKLISEAIDRVYYIMIMNTPPKSEDERLHCEAIKEAVKGMFLKESRSEVEANFIVDNIAKYEEIFEICMNGNDLQFKKRLIELQRMQNDYILEKESSIS